MVRANRICIVLLLAALAAAPLWADGSLFGTIAGKTRDESGGALPGVTVTLTSEQKGVQRTETTDASGSFTFALLPPGTYTVKATGKSASMYMQHWWRFADGKIVFFRGSEDSEQSARAFGKA